MREGFVSFDIPVEQSQKLEALKETATDFSGPCFWMQYPETIDLFSLFLSAQLLAKWAKIAQQMEELLSSPLNSNLLFGFFLRAYSCAVFQQSRYFCIVERKIFFVEFLPFVRGFEALTWVPKSFKSHAETESWTILSLANVIRNALKWQVKCMKTTRMLFHPAETSGNITEQKILTFKWSMQLCRSGEPQRCHFTATDLSCRRLVTSPVSPCVKLKREVFHI